MLVSHNFTRNLCMFLDSFEFRIENKNESLEQIVVIMKTKIFWKATSFVPYINWKKKLETKKKKFFGHIRPHFHTTETVLWKQFYQNFY